MVVQDVMTIAGNTITQPFGVALQESVQFSAASVPFDGLVGLAQSALSEQKVATPIEALAKAGTIPAGIVSYDLGRVADGANTGQSESLQFDPSFSLLNGFASSRSPLPSTSETDDLRSFCFVRSLLRRR